MTLCLIACCSCSCDRNEGMDIEIILLVKRARAATNTLTTISGRPKEERAPQARARTPDLPSSFISLLFYNIYPSPVLHSQIHIFRFTFPLRPLPSPALRPVTSSLQYLSAISIMTSFSEGFAGTPATMSAPWPKKRPGPSEEPDHSTKSWKQVKLSRPFTDME